MKDGMPIETVEKILKAFRECERRFKEKAKRIKRKSTYLSSLTQTDVKTEK